MGALAPQEQMVMVACWLSMKEVSLVLGTLARGCAAGDGGEAGGETRGVPEASQGGEGGWEAGGMPATAGVGEGADGCTEGDALPPLLSAHQLKVRGGAVLP